MPIFPFTNIHSHIFNSDCAPDRFLRIIPSGFIRKFAKPIKRGVDSNLSYKILNLSAKILSKKESSNRGMFDKMISFLDIGTEREQSDIFKMTLQTGTKYDSKVRIVALSLDMDHMDNSPSLYMKNFRTQLEELKEIKRYYPDQIFLFLGIDPRNKQYEELLTWAKDFFQKGVEKNGIVYPYFCGVKLYPALGFFPFDPALENLYAYCETNQIPIITHCTRVGSQYIGEEIESLIPVSPKTIEVPDNDHFSIAKKEIEERIERYRKAGWIKNNNKGENDLACDLFGHPQNYIPILEKFPRLKICLAHLGGSNEILNSNSEKTLGVDLSQIRKTDGYNWFERIKTYMKQYPHLYSDISYTLSSFEKKAVTKQVLEFMNEEDINGNLLGKRILFGTDFFMTEQENHEEDLYKLAEISLKDWFEIICRVNTQEFLQQPLEKHKETEHLPGVYS